jgi:cytochrome c oxidase cbb3-type subunit 3
MSQAPRSLSPAVLAGIALGALLLGLLVFWSFPAPASLPEWTPADHDQPEGQPLPPQRPPRAQPQEDSASLAELAWMRSCAQCHGAMGRGDGPQGPMLRAPDLTRADWQQKVSDDEIRQTIRNGRNNMPKFDVPPAVIDGLVKRIRDNRAK